MFRKQVLTNKINGFVRNSLESNSQTQVNFYDHLYNQQDYPKY